MALGSGDLLVFAHCRVGVLAVRGCPCLRDVCKIGRNKSQFSRFQLLPRSDIVFDLEQDVDAVIIAKEGHFGDECPHITDVVVSPGQLVPSAKDYCCSWCFAVSRFAIDLIEAASERDRLIVTSGVSFSGFWGGVQGEVGTKRRLWKTCEGQS